MSSQRYTPEFKDEAVRRQVVDRGYCVAEVSERRAKYCESAPSCDERKRSATS